MAFLNAVGGAAGGAPRSRARASTRVCRWRASAETREAEDDAKSAGHAVAQPQRRALLGGALAAATLAALGGDMEAARAEAVTGRSVVNGILSGYGLPQFPDKSGYTPVLESYGKDKLVEFMFPNSWLLVKEQQGIDRPRLNAERVVPTINVSDYRKAEGIAFYSVPSSSTKNVFDVDSSKLGSIAITSPRPDFTVVKDRKIGDGGYRYTLFKFETNTPSGFNAQRRAIAVSTVVDDTLFVLGGNCTELRYKTVEPIFDNIANSFRVSKVNKK